MLMEFNAEILIAGSFSLQWTSFQQIPLLPVWRTLLFINVVYLAGFPGYKGWELNFRVKVEALAADKFSHH